MSREHVLIDGELWEVREESTGGLECEGDDCGAPVDYCLLAEEGGRMFLCEPCLLRLKQQEAADEAEVCERLLIAEMLKRAS